MFLLTMWFLGFGFTVGFLGKSDIKGKDINLFLFITELSILFLLWPIDLGKAVRNATLKESKKGGGLEN